MRAAQSLIAACYSKACAPPPTGKGGSTKGGTSSVGRRSQVDPTMMGYRPLPSGWSLEEKPDGDLRLVQPKTNSYGPKMTQAEAIAQGWVGPFFHGTTPTNARNIRQRGFREPRYASWELEDFGNIEEILKDENWWVWTSSAPGNGYGDAEVMVYLRPGKFHAQPGLFNGLPAYVAESYADAAVITDYRGGSDAHQSLIAACYSKACAPPPVGRGGSSKGAGATRSGSRTWKDWMWGYSHSHSTGITTHAARIMGIDDSKGKTDRRYQVRAEGVLDAIRDSKPTKLVRQHATARAMVPADARVGSVVTLPPVATEPHDPEFPDYGWAIKNMKPKDNGEVTILVFPAGTARTARYMDGRRSDEEEITAGKFEIVGIDRATSGRRASPQFDYDKQDWHYFPTTYYTLRQTHVFDRRTGTYVSVDAPQAPSAVVAACYSAACAPPSAGGTGGPESKARVDGMKEAFHKRFGEQP